MELEISLAQILFSSQSDRFLQQIPNKTVILLIISLKKVGITELKVSSSDQILCCITLLLFEVLLRNVLCDMYSSTLLAYNK